MWKLRGISGVAFDSLFREEEESSHFEPYLYIYLLSNAMLYIKRTTNTFFIIPLISHVLVFNVYRCKVTIIRILS